MGWVVNATPRLLYHWYPLYRRLGGPQDWSGWVQKISSPLEFDTQTVQPVVSHYTTELSQPTYCHFTTFYIFLVHASNT